MAELPKPLATFVAQHADALVIDVDAGGPTATGQAPRVAVVARDFRAVREFAPSVRTRVLGVFLSEVTGARSLLPSSGWPTLLGWRSRRAAGGSWTVLRFAAPVDVGSVLAHLGGRATAATSGVGEAWRAAPAVSPRGFDRNATEPVVELDSLDLRHDVTPHLVASLRPAQGVRVCGWSASIERTVGSLALAGVPVLAPDAAGPLAPLLSRDVDLADPMAREEHSVELRRRAFDVSALPSAPQPSLSVLLPTRRPEMLDFALAQVARQRGVADLEVVVAPHGFEVSEADVAARVPGVAVRVLPHPEQVLFGDVLHAAASAARGDVLLKMDDDDWYAPDAAADLLRARAYSGADLVGMPADVQYLSEPHLTVYRGLPTERYGSFVAGGTMLIGRDTLRYLGGWRSVRRFVDAQLLRNLLDAGGTLYVTHGLGYLLRRNATGHTWEVGLDYLLDPARTAGTAPGFTPGRLLEIDPAHWPSAPRPSAP